MSKLVFTDMQRERPLSSTTQQQQLLIPGLTFSFPPTCLRPDLVNEDSSFTLLLFG